MEEITTVYTRKSDKEIDAFSIPIIEQDLPIIGYRAWVIIAEHLSSLSTPEIWWSKKKKFRCTEHGVPGLADRCGLHALHSLEEIRALYTDPDFIYGQVKGWGRIINHEYGFRAEFLEILAFLQENDKKDKLSALSFVYGVPVFNQREIVVRGLEEGISKNTDSYRELRLQQFIIRIQMKYKNKTIA